MAQIFPIDFEEKLTMAQDDYILFSDSEDWNKIKKAQYKNLKGEKGDPWTPWQDWEDWAAATITVWSTTTGVPWSSASVTNSWTSSAAILDFTIPQWAKWEPWKDGQDWSDGAAATITVWTTTTLPAWSSATVTNVGTSSAAVFDFGIPQGTPGTWSWDVSWPASSTDGDLAMFDGATWKIIKDWGALTTKVFTLANTSDTTNAQAAYDWYKAGKMAVILYSGNYYFFKWTWANSVYFAVNEYTPLDNTNVTSLVQKTLTLGLSWTTVTTISSRNMSMTGYNVLKTGKDYSTPYTPQYDGSPATKKYVDDSVADLMWLWKFLSLWDATTWQPISFPLSTPYTYTTWDYFLVETVSTATPPVNYKPNGSSYTGTASSTTESGELEVWDIYIYDGTTWLLQLNHGKTVSFSEIAGSPSDNTALGNALWSKQDSLTLPATPTSWHLVTWWADNETLADGWAVPTWVPSWWTDGQVLSKVSGNIAWANASWWDVKVSSQSWNILTTWMKIWAWTQSDYEWLWTYDNNTVYLTI